MVSPQAGEEDTAAELEAKEPRGLKEGICPLGLTSLFAALSALPQLKLLIENRLKNCGNSCLAGKCREGAPDRQLPPPPPNHRAQQPWQGAPALPVLSSV